jgi:hypothetical protein
VKVKRKAEQDLKRIPGVTAVSVGAKRKDGKKQDELAICVFVRKKRGRTEIPENEVIPEKIEGISTDVMEGEPSVISYSGSSLDRTKHDKMIGGINIGQIEEDGTLGAIAFDQTGTPVILFSAHVALGKHMNAPLGTSINNPGEDNNHQVGKLSDFDISTMDAAIASINDPHGYECGMMHPNMGPIKGIATDTEVHNMLHSRVKKVGAATNFTTGTIEFVDQPARLSYDDGRIVLDLEGQIVIKSDTASVFSAGGDSGACIMNDSGKIIGLLIGAAEGMGSFATPIERILKRFQINICLS